MSHRIRLRLGSAEFEVEGPEDFVQREAKRLENIVRSNPTDPGTESVGRGSELRQPGTEATMSFGDLLQSVDSNAGTDRMLLAGWFVQERSEDRLFSTSDANALLKEQGIRLGNPSQTATNLQKGKLIFREKRKYRVSRVGQERIRELLR